MEEMHRGRAFDTSVTTIMGHETYTEKEGAAIMTSTSMARPHRTNTNYGKGSFGHEQLDFQSMTTESFTKSKLKREVESSSTEMEQEDESN
jgi:hypothetical protein